MCFSDIVYIFIVYMVYCTCIITKYGCVFLKLGESIYVAMDLIPILLGSLPLTHNAQHSLVIIASVHCGLPPFRARFNYA